MADSHPQCYITARENSACRNDGADGEETANQNGLDVLEKQPVYSWGGGLQRWMMIGLITTSDPFNLHKQNAFFHFYKSITISAEVLN